MKGGREKRGVNGLQIGSHQGERRRRKQAENNRVYRQEREKINSLRRDLAWEGNGFLMTSDQNLMMATQGAHMWLIQQITTSRLSLYVMSSLFSKLHLVPQTNTNPSQFLVISLIAFSQCALSFILLTRIIIHSNSVPQLITLSSLLLSLPIYKPVKNLSSHNVELPILAERAKLNIDFNQNTLQDYHLI